VEIAGLDNDGQTSPATRSVKELKDNMAKLSRQNDELSKEVGRLRLLEEHAMYRQRNSGFCFNAATPSVDEI